MENQDVIVVSGENCMMFNAENGNTIRVLNKNQEFHPRTLTLIGEDYILGALTSKPGLKVITVAKKIGHTGDFILPGFATALGATSCGTFCFAGIQNSLYAWKVSTGDLLAIIPNHYQEITVIKCSSDDSHVLTAGKDGQVFVWMLADLVAINRSVDEKKPRFTWLHHSAEITDMFITPLGNYSRVVTVSSDMTCRMYELRFGSLIITISMEVPLTAVTMDTFQSFIFIGDTLGYLHRINIFDKLPKLMESHELRNSDFRIHQAKIVSLDMYSDGTKLLSSSEDRSIRVWDIQSLSCILRIEIEGNITNAFLTIKPTPLVDDSIKPLFDICYFKRSLEESRKEKPKAATKTWQTKISSMLHTSSGLCYNPSNLRKGVNTEANGPSAIDSFDAVANAHTVGELTAINNNLYATISNLILDTVPFTEDGEMDS